MDERLWGAGGLAITGVDEWPECATWLGQLRDGSGRGAILAALDRIRCGKKLVGDWKPVGGDVFELRINKGPGYRVYFFVEPDGTMMVVYAGTKRTQVKDITRAHGIRRKLRGEMRP